MQRPLADFRTLFLIASACCLLQMPAAAAAGSQRPSGGEIAIHPLAPDRRGGKAYKLVYLVRVPMEPYWKFKTDFDNDFVGSHKHIRVHRFISRSGNTVITENRYTSGPDVLYRWQITVIPEAHRLDFVLLNPKTCGQAFHYGHIRVEPDGGRTRVTQIAYFDFAGASLWADFPWGGGMKDFLSYTARWEQDTAVRLKDRYSE